MNPGSIDTQQAVYLAACDVFVTADKGQYGVLRRILPLAKRRRRVLMYEALRKHLLDP